MSWLWSRSIPLALLSLVSLALARGGTAPVTYRASFEGGVEAWQGARVLWRTPLKASRDEVQVLGNVLLVEGFAGENEVTYVLSRGDRHILAQPAGHLTGTLADGATLTFVDFRLRSGEVIRTLLDRHGQAGVQRVNLWSLFPPDCKAEKGSAGSLRLDERGPLLFLFHGLAGHCEGILSFDFQGNVGLTLKRVR
ncbi:hypothetical protein [Deinococcus geothermalis]|uniref:Uncharacterized protein n=1 Tax=Deinococcus geothermalis (strain DSM 11300 / CIP 105573 / AG-3a) TaxID=319795 RepID=Q1IX05_DEIGD|nr:hypothetical protein [Deinococcus geothermalis]ABF46229.1 hypothetical protein Dgeo_1935 [Deinococcus geothermalis DSM 11300]